MRPLLFSIAYRMLGSVADAEDVVQETFLRWHRAEAEGAVVESAKSYLAAITTRLSIDHLRSARVRREEYVGLWLPEPMILRNGGEARGDVDQAESLSMAFLLLLETLSPVERAVFLLREVFEFGYDAIAGIVEKSEANCRQIFVRAKERVDAGKPRFEGSREKRDELSRRFLSACQTGDLGGLVTMLAADATFHGDGGGKATAVARAVQGRDRVARLLHAIFVKARQIGVRVEAAEVNGQPGAMTFDDQDRVISVFVLEIADGAVQAVRSVINPDKLQHLGPVSDLARIAKA